MSYKIIPTIPNQHLTACTRLRYNDSVMRGISHPPNLAGRVASRMALAGALGGAASMVTLSPLGKAGVNRGHGLEPPPSSPTPAKVGSTELITIDNLTTRRL